MVDTIITVLYSCSAISGLYVGWRNGYIVKNIMNHPQIKPYKDKLMPFDKNNIATEDIVCNMSGSLTGLIIGRYIWPIFIPYSVFYIGKHHGKSISSFFKSIK
jgi:hypothetical protein